MLKLAKSSAISQLVHSISILDIPEDYIKAADSEIFKFIWKKKEEVHIPNFYKLLLYYFAELKSFYNPQESDHELVIFNNKQSRINDRTIFYGSWFIGMLLLLKIFWERMGSSSLTQSSFEHTI